MPRRPLEILLEYFPAGTTEGERHLLSRAFVHWDEYTELLTPPATNPRLLVGKKGTGKTAVIDFYSTVLKASGIPTLTVRPVDIDLSIFPQTGALGETTRLALQALTRAIASSLGSQLSGLLDSPSKTLYDEAVASGEKRRDFIEAMVQFVPRIAQGFSKADLSAILPGASNASVHQLQEAISANVARSGTSIYLFVDDTDQVAAPDTPGHLNRIWAFLLATRELAQRIPQLRPVISIREEVWRRLVRDAAGQRDQADHFVALVRYLFPSRTHIRAVVERRLQLAAEDAKGKGENAYAPFFEGVGAHMPSSREFSSWQDLIVVRSRERPRDAIQLVSILARQALSRGAQRIEEKDFEAGIREYSAQRVQFLAQEAEAECPQITTVVESLAHLPYDHGGFKITFEPLRQELRRLPSQFGVTLFGRAVRPDNDDDALALLRFLYELGIVNARVSDTREKDGFRHVGPAEDPNLVARSRWNDLQAVVWEVNPAYRDHLIRIQTDTSAQVGLPPRRRR